MIKKLFISFLDEYGLAELIQDKDININALNTDQ